MKKVLFCWYQKSPIHLLHQINQIMFVTKFTNNFNYSPRCDMLMRESHTVREWNRHAERQGDTLAENGQNRKEISGQKNPGKRNGYWYFISIEILSLHNSLSNEVLYHEKLFCGNFPSFSVCTQCCVTLVGGKKCHSSTIYSGVLFTYRCMISNMQLKDVHNIRDHHLCYFWALILIQSAFLVHMIYHTSCLLERIKFNNYMLLFVY